MAEKYELLRDHFGFQTFRCGQEPLIDGLTAGRDVLGIMPTGAGKSLCYQVPAMMLPGITIVISPLISLMKDQVGAMKQAGVAAAYINSSLTYAQIEEVMARAARGDYKIIYVAPERLLSDGFLRFAMEADIALAAIDEAHCVSQWGQDFRPSYLRIRDFLARLPKRPTVGAFTATATPQVRDDIVSLLSLDDPLIVTTSFDRPNLYFDVAQPKDRYSTLVNFLMERRDKSGIIYCLTRKDVEDICERLQRQGFQSTRYHAGLGDRERHQNQERFQSDEAAIMVATNAFGMGIDKSNVAFVVHYNMPKDLESYYQEAGRAGRDGADVDCLLLFNGQDIRTNKYFIYHDRDNDALDRDALATVQKAAERRLQAMIDYSRTISCLRHKILSYFGEDSPTSCANCANCRNTAEEIEVTAAARAVLRTVRDMGQRFGKTLVIDVLRGSRNGRVRELRFDQLDTYGQLKTSTAAEVRDILDLLLEDGYLRTTEDEYPVLRLTAQSKELFEDGTTVMLRRKKAEETPAPILKPKAAAMESLSYEEQTLFQALRQLRLALARSQGIPPYLIFSDATLRHMCQLRPQSEGELLHVTGVGQAKLERYGAAFLAVLTGDEASIDNEYTYETAEQYRDAEDSPAPYSPQKRSKPSRASVPWSKAEEAQLTKEISLGFPVHEIAELHERSLSSIYARIKKLGLTEE